MHQYECRRRSDDDIRSCRQRCYRDETDGHCRYDLDHPAGEIVHGDSHTIGYSGMSYHEGLTVPVDRLIAIAAYLGLQRSPVENVSPYHRFASRS